MAEDGIGDSTWKAALLRARTKFGSIKKDAVNPHFNNAYAQLGTVLDAITPALASEGFFLTQVCGFVGEKSVLRTELWHLSEDQPVLLSHLPLNAEHADHKMGSSMSYARRYAINAMFSLAAEEDDDGNHASSLPPSDAEKQMGGIRVYPDTIKARGKGPGRPMAAKQAMGLVWRNLGEHFGDVSPWQKDSEGNFTKEAQAKQRVIVTLFGSERVGKVPGMAKLSAMQENDPDFVITTVRENLDDVIQAVKQGLVQEEGTDEIPF